MLSVVMPYWNRKKALKRTLESYKKYKDIEVIVVDDGSPEPAEPIPADFPIRIIRLPDKDIAKNPCVPINVGFRAARGSHVAITNPEIWHPFPVFEQMISDHYVLASCYDRSRDEWFCKTGKTYPTPMPPDYGLHFCGVIPKEQIKEFDESFRNGVGYDDNDWAWTLYTAKVKCEIRDDLVVQHEQDERIKWKLPSNRDRFFRKWRM